MIGVKEYNERKDRGLGLAHKFVFCLTCAIFKIFGLVAYTKKKKKKGVSGFWRLLTKQNIQQQWATFLNDFGQS